jgi:hypothetical protein
MRIRDEHNALFEDMRRRVLAPVAREIVFRHKNHGKPSG